MYNIKQAAARAGVSVPVLRAWERRYGIVAPERSPSGYRRFDDAGVARVRAMRSLIEEGWSPSAAAAAIVSGEVSVAAPAGPGRATAAAAWETAANGAAATELAERVVAGARNLDAATIESALDELFSRGTFERVASELLFPTLERLGDAWATGEVSVAGEHLASSAVQRRLAIALDAAGAPARGGASVVVGLPPGGRHELGALAFAVAARRAGLKVAYLGADLPVADWVTASEKSEAVVIGVVTGRDRRAALAVARAVRAAHPKVVVAFGGDASPDEPGVMRLPRGLLAAVGMLDRALAPGAP